MSSLSVSYAPWMLDNYQDLVGSALTSPLATPLATPIASPLPLWAGFDSCAVAYPLPEALCLHHGLDLIG